MKANKFIWLKMIAWSSYPLGLLTSKIFDLDQPGIIWGDPGDRIIEIISS